MHDIGLEERLLQLMKDMLEECRVVNDWRNALIIPILKKDDLSICDNWRDISLLDVVGKVFARIVRLQQIAEDSLLDS